MTFNVFITSSSYDNAIVEELRATLKRYDIVTNSAVEIPFGASIEESLRQQIAASDCILAIIGCNLRKSQNVNYEMKLAKSLGKAVIPFVEEGAEVLPEIANLQFIPIDRDNPKLSYERAAKYLSQLKLEKEQRNAIGGLILLGLGLLLLGAIASEK